MAAKDEIGFEHKGIGSALAHNRLAVPLNQREYSWSDEHVRELLTDFSNAIENNEGTYFLGTIVLTHGKGDVPEVSDGQQRLATTTILLAAIRDYFKAAKDWARATSIEQDFLKTTDLETTDTVPKLKLNVDDNEFFTKYVVMGEHGLMPTRESHRRIKEAADLAAQHIRDILEQHGSQKAKTSRLLEWVKFIRDGAEVILLKVPDHLNAFVMFETLNDRGLRASQADLLKNYLLSYCGPSRISEGQQKWAHMIGVLESLSVEDITMTYLHHVLITKTGPTKGSEVFSKVRQMVSSQARSMEFLDDLSERAHDYAALFNSDHKKWNEYGTATRHHISTINRDLRVEQIRPLMFAVAHKFAKAEAKLAFKLFVFWSVRFLVVGGRGGLLDRNYAVRAQEVTSGKIKTAKALTAAMLDVIPTDALFKAAFAELRVSQSFHARYYLRALEQKIKGLNEPEFVPTDDEQAVNLEHILPENPANNWPEFDVDTASAYFKRLGNMAIIQAKQNAIVANGKFVDKKAIFKTSPYELTAELSKYSTWGPKQINERQARLAQTAVETWTIHG